MFEYEFIEKLFRELEMFINDYVRFFEMMNEHSHGNILSIRLSEEEFYFPCTWTEFAHRAKQLHDRLQTPMRSLAQTRRKEISRGIDVRHQYSTNNQRIRFQSEFKVRLEQMHNIGNLSRIRMIIDALELYDEIRIQPSSLNITFRLLPIVQYIQQQVDQFPNDIHVWIHVDRSYVVFPIIFKKS